METDMWRWLTLLLVFVATSTSVWAGSPFDGRWEWQVELNNQCSSVVFEDLQITDGRVKSSGRHYVGTFNITGSVTEDGRVSLYGSVPQHKLVASGALEELVGRGDISISSGRGDCNGSWVAEKAP